MYATAFTYMNGKILYKTFLSKLHFHNNNIHVSLSTKNHLSFLIYKRKQLHYVIWSTLTVDMVTIATAVIAHSLVY